MPDLPEKLGPYRIERLLGQGGMGTVYLGEQEDTGDKAAVKTLSPTLAADEGLRNRFAAEIESLKKLRHPNIVQLVGYGEQDGQLFYAMEFVEGTSLQDLLQGGRRFDWQQATRIGIDVCKALKHAHDSGVIHRDLKPANLMLTPDGRVKLTDFGIAKLFGYSQLTADGGVIGTADYMAPEQAQGQKVTNRCDLYSLGVVMYALMAGRPPFVGHTLPEVIRRVCFEEPDPLRRFATDVPVELEALVHDLLQKDPQQRIPTAMALGKRLEATLHGLSTRQQRQARREEPSSDESDFEVAQPGEAGLASDPADHAASTRWAPTQARDVGPTQVPGESPQRPDVTEILSSEKTDMNTSAAAIEAASSAQAPAPVHDTHFRTVQQDIASQRQTDQVERPLLSTAIRAILGAALLGIAATVLWFVTRPPSANALYDRIEAAAETGAYDSLADASRDMQRFVELYPGDRRAAEVKGYQDELELMRLQRNFERRGRRLSAAASLSPVQRAYLDVVEVARSRPEEAIIKLQAILDVYGAQADPSRDTSQVLELAARQLQQLKKAVAQSGDEHQQELESLLELAHQRQKSNRESAEAIYRGIILLHSDKPWAAEIVKQARRSLDELAQGE